MQPVVDGVISTCLVLPVALGFYLYYRVTGILHFAHGAIIPIGGYSFLEMTERNGLPVAAAAPLAITAGVLVGILIELFLYRPLRDWDQRRLGTFVVSFATYTMLAAALSLHFGDGTRLSGLFPAMEGVAVLGSRVSGARMMIVGSAVVILGMTWAFLHLTRYGLLLRAVASNPFLARVAGVHVGSVYVCAIGLASAFAATTGILISLDSGLSPNSGLGPLLLGVIAVLVGGRNVAGVVVGALILGLAQHIAVIWIAAKWQDTIAYAILALVLLFRPGGLIGSEKPKVES